MRVIVTLKVKLSKSVEESLQFHNGMFSPEHMDHFKSIGNIAHYVSIHTQQKAYIMATDIWEVEDLKVVEEFYNSENFKKNMAGKFSSEAPEIDIWIQDPAWAQFS